MMYVGIDLHRKRSQIAALDEDGGEILSRRIGNDPEVFSAILAELGGDAKVALEATYGWEWLADLLEDEGAELHLAHPLRTKAIASARVKTDAVDARTLAHLLPPICSRKRMSPRASCVICASCCAIASS
jgi:transposase